MLLTTALQHDPEELLGWEKMGWLEKDAGRTHSLVYVWLILIQVDRGGRTPLANGILRTCLWGEVR